jgi:hypothetical protein
MTPQIEQLTQLSKGPVWDGNLISKEARDWLHKHELIDRLDGWNFLTRTGMAHCITLGILKP